MTIVFLAAAARAETVTVSLLATTDMHGNLLPIDYFTDEPAARGLVKLATIIRQERAANPNSLLVDCGDTIQGSPLEEVYQSYVRDGHLPVGLSFSGRPPARDPMMQAMNRLGYDSMTVGNHEFNFGLKNFDRAREDAKFPWISANIETAPGSGRRPFAPYIIKTIAGVKIAIIGITTPSVPNWEMPENYAGYRFLPGVNAVKSVVAELHRVERPDLIVVAAHAGLDRDLKTGLINSNQIPGENMAYEIAAEVPSLDAVVYGHTHAELSGITVGNVLLAQPKNWAMSLVRMDFQMQRQGGHWSVAQKSSRLLRVTGDTPADEALVSMAQPYHEITERYLNTGVAESEKAMEGTYGRVEDTPLVDAIQTVERHYAKADVSFASLFNQHVHVPKGPVTVRQIAALYLYDNELYAIEGNGKMVKDALENSARYFLSCQAEKCSEGPLINSRIIGFNYDMAEGVQYEIDLTRAEGDRIRNLTWQGRPLDPEQPLRIAVNSYRAGGSAGYSMFVGAKVVWRSMAGVRDLMIQYYTERKRLPIEPNGNWRIVPPAAIPTLEREAAAEAKRVRPM